MQVLRDILDEYFGRQRSSSAKTGVDPHVRNQLKDLLRSTNPSAVKVLISLEQKRHLYSVV